jgi:ABC-type antimicrobial peptide transport system permease subunit
VVGWVAAEIGRLLAVGCFAGLAAAAIGTRFLTSLLYGVAPHDPRTALGVLALLALIGAMAAGLPAYQAARVDPVTALRRE